MWLKYVVLACIATVALAAAACGGGKEEVALPVVVDVDTVTSGPGEGLVDADQSCVQQNVFKRGMHVVFRMDARDTVTGEALSDADVSKAVVRLPTGEEFPFNYSQHGEGENAPFFWTAAWDVPEDYPMGTVDYEVTLTTADGGTVSWTQPRPVPPSLLQIAE